MYTHLMISHIIDVSVIVIDIVMIILLLVSAGLRPPAPLQRVKSS